MRQPDGPTGIRLSAALLEKAIAMNDTENYADRTPELPIEPRRQKTTQTGPASALAREDRDIGLDLNRIVWDPEYRRKVIERLASQASDPGNADKPG